MTKDIIKTKTAAAPMWRVESLKEGAYGYDRHNPQYRLINDGAKKTIPEWHNAWMNHRQAAAELSRLQQDGEAMTTECVKMAEFHNRRQQRPAFGLPPAFVLFNS